MDSSNPELESKSEEVTYYVLSLGMDVPAGKGKERHLDTGDTITRSELLAFTRAKYIDAMVASGDLGLDPPTEES